MIMSNLGGGRENCENDPQKGSSTAHRASQSGQEGAAIDAEGRVSHFDRLVKDQNEAAAFEHGRRAVDKS